LFNKAVATVYDAVALESFITVVANVLIVDTLTKYILAAPPVPAVHVRAGVTDTPVAPNVGAVSVTAPGAPTIVVKFDDT
jgi:hypothetical protein